MDVLMDEFSLLCKAAPVDSPSQQGSKVVFLKLGLRAGLDLGWKSKIMEASMGVQWACSAPAAWNKIDFSCTVPTSLCKLVGAKLRPIW
jgi:hypothetical protein